MSCPAFCKSCNNCKKSNHFAKGVGLRNKRTILLEKKSISKKKYFRLFLLYWAYRLYGESTIEEIILDGKETPMMKDTGASLKLFRKSRGSRLDNRNLKQRTRELETYDKYEMKILGAFFSRVFYKIKEVNVSNAVVDA